MANIVYICHQPGPLNSALRECIDMLLTGAAFGQPTTLWLAGPSLQALALSRELDEQLENLPAFGVRCVALADDLAVAGKLPLPVTALDRQALAALHQDAQQVVVF